MNKMSTKTIITLVVLLIAIIVIIIIFSGSGGNIPSVTEILNPTSTSTPEQTATSSQTAGTATKKTTSTANKPALIQSSIIITGITHDLADPKCSIKNTSGAGGTVQNILELSFNDRVIANQYAVFTIQDFENNASNLLKLGEHDATGNFWDTFYSTLDKGYSYSISYITGDEMSVVWNKITTSAYGFSGSGYIQIKKRIDVNAPGAIKGTYIPAQTINFQCLSGTR